MGLAEEWFRCDRLTEPAKLVLILPSVIFFGTFWVMLGEVSLTCTIILQKFLTHQSQFTVSDYDFVDQTW